MSQTCCCDSGDLTVNDVFEDLRNLEEIINSGHTSSTSVQQNPPCRCEPCRCPSDTVPCNAGEWDGDLSDQGLLRKLSRLTKQAREVQSAQDGGCNCPNLPRLPANSPLLEGTGHTISQKQSQVTKLNPSPQMSLPMRDWALYSESPEDFRIHPIIIEVRVPSRLSGDDNGPILRFEDVINDTGSTLGTIFSSEWDILNVNNIQSSEPTKVLLADGTEVRGRKVTHETRLVQWVDDGLFAISDWMEDQSILKENSPTRNLSTHQLFQRLSSNTMRRHLFFLTPPILYDNTSDFSLYVSRTKEGMIQALQSQVTAVVRERRQQDIPMLDYGCYPASQNDALGQHRIRVQVRLPAHLGGSDNGHVIEFDDVLNDTGAMHGVMFTDEWARLNVNNTPSTQTAVLLPNGSTQIMRVVVYETRLIQRTDEGLFAVSGWMEDKSHLMDRPIPGQTIERLSGFAMRQRLFLLTPPTDIKNCLYVSRTKEAIFEILQSL